MVLLVKWLWVDGLSIFPFILIRKDKYSIWLLNHEYIHSEQQKECLFIFAYIVYFIEFLVKLLYYKDVHKAYINVSFEREAFMHEKTIGYIRVRKRFNWVKYIWQK